MISSRDQHERCQNLQLHLLSYTQEGNTLLHKPTGCHTCHLGFESVYMNGKHGMDN